MENRKKLCKSEFLKTKKVKNWSVFMDLLQNLKKTKSVYILWLSFKKSCIVAVILCMSKKRSLESDFSFVCI